MRFFVAPSTVELAYRVVGHGTRAAVLLHDWGMTGSAWADLLSRWRPEALTIHVPDLRSCGDSPRGSQEQTLDLMLDDIVRFCEDRELDQILVIGQGMGAALAQMLAAQEPRMVERVVLLNPVPATGVPMSPGLLAMHERAIDSPAEMAHLLSLGLGADPAAAALVRRLERSAASWDSAALRASLPAWQKAWFPEMLAKIRCPVLVVGSTGDPVVKSYVVADEVATPIRQARLEMLPSASHNLSNEQPGAVAAAIERFRRAPLLLAPVRRSGAQPLPSAANS